jgi:hypothetical protein
MKRRRYIYGHYEVVIQTENNLVWEGVIFINRNMIERFTFDGEPSIELVLLKYAFRCAAHLELLGKVTEV